MKLAKLLHAGETHVGIIKDDTVTLLSLSGGHFHSLAEILESDNPSQSAEFMVDAGSKPVPLSKVTLLPPIDNQEVWAAGVTYRRSKSARMEESDAAARCYDLVYESLRPEIFFKANARRVSGTGQPLRIRRDSNWNVPEPELTLVLNSRMELVGYTIGNDMSSRDIEGENPLYLPQAKVYDQCCGLGPWITLAGAMPPVMEIGIEIKITRQHDLLFQGSTDIGHMARSFEELIEYLKFDNSMPEGAFLLTGTGIVPENDFTLLPGDEVQISIDGIGTLSNQIIQG